MSITGNEFTLVSLEVLISKINNQLASSHLRALELYPNTTYQALDGLSVSLGKLKASLSLHLQLKKLELGVISNEELIAHLNQRLSNLEDFYLVAGTGDAPAIEKSILEIKSLLLGIKKDNHNARQKKFYITLDDSMTELINEFQL